MYNKIKTCLLFPRKIADYMDEPNKKTVGFFFFLLTLLVIPTIVALVISKSPDMDINLRANSNETIISSYIEEGKLKDSQEIPELEYVNGTISAAFPVLYIFNPTGLSEEEALQQVLASDICVYLYFAEDYVGIGGALPDEYVDGKVSKTTFYGLFNYTYEELGVKSLSFNDMMNESKLDDFDSQAAVLVDGIYQKLLMKFLPLVIILGVIPGCAEALLIEFLISTIIVLIVCSRFGLKFGKIFKTAILCGLPMVIGSIISSFTNWGLFDFIGGLVSFGYLYRAVFTYRLIMGRPGENSDVDNTPKEFTGEVKIMPGVYAHHEEEPDTENKDIIDSSDYTVDESQYSEDDKDNNDNQNEENN